MFTNRALPYLAIIALALPLYLGTEVMADDYKPGKSWKIENGVIPQELRDIFKEILARPSYFDQEGLIPIPPWQAYPEPRISLRWRMGDGENFLDGFKAWFARQPHEARVSYIRTYPEPEGWSGFYAGQKGGAEALEEAARAE